MSHIILSQCLGCLASGSPSVLWWMGRPRGTSASCPACHSPAQRPLEQGRCGGECPGCRGNPSPLPWGRGIGNRGQTEGHVSQTQCTACSPPLRTPCRPSGHPGVSAKVFCLAPGPHSPLISSEYGAEAAVTNYVQAKTIKRIQFNLGAQLLMPCDLSCPGKWGASGIL